MRLVSGLKNTCATKTKDHEKIVSMMMMMIICPKQGTWLFGVSFEASGEYFMLKKHFWSREEKGQEETNSHGCR